MEMSMSCVLEPAGTSKTPWSHSLHPSIVMHSDRHQGTIDRHIDGKAKVSRPLTELHSRHGAVPCKGVVC